MLNEWAFSNFFILAGITGAVYVFLAIGIILIGLSLYSIAGAKENESLVKKVLCQVATPTIISVISMLVGAGLKYFGF